MFRACLARVFWPSTLVHAFGFWRVQSAPSAPFGGRGCLQSPAVNPGSIRHGPTSIIAERGGQRRGPRVIMAERGGQRRGLWAIIDERGSQRLGPRACDTSAIPARKPTAIPGSSANPALQIPWCTHSAFGLFRPRLARLARLEAAAAVFKARPSIRTLFATL